MKRHTKKSAIAAAILAAGILNSSPQAQAAAFSASDLIVDRVGTGGAALANVGTAAFLDVFARTGTGQTASQSISLTQNGNNLEQAGSSTSEGLISLSADGSSLIVPGYNTASTANVVSSSATTNPRAIAVFGPAGTEASFTTLGTTAFSAGNIRGAASVNGTSLYASGSNTGIVNATAGGSTSTVVFNTVANVRALNVFTPTSTNIQSLYYSTSSGTTGIYTLSGLPTASGAASTLLVADSSPYGFSISPDGKTIYVADDSGGIKKFTSPSGAASTFTLAATFATASRGLTVDYSGTNPILYATSAPVSGANTLFSITDDGIASDFSGQTATILATAATNTAFRGVSFAPVPEPATLAAGGLSALAFLGSQRRRLRAGLKVVSAFFA